MIDKKTYISVILIYSIDDTYGGMIHVKGIWGSSKPFYEMDSEAFQNVLDVNTKGMFLMSKYVARTMITQKRV